MEVIIVVVDLEEVVLMVNFEVEEIQAEVAVVEGVLVEGHMDQQMLLIQMLSPQLLISANFTSEVVIVGMVTGAGD